MRKSKNSAAPKPIPLLREVNCMAASLELTTRTGREIRHTFAEVTGWLLGMGLSARQASVIKL